MTAALKMIGHEAAEARFAAARSSGRLHHGWIVRGPSGIGKSLFVRRQLAVILGAQSGDAPADDPVMQKILSGSHADLHWVKRELNEKGQLRQDITVDQIRALNKFFSLRPALAGWRIGVVDALDEMNVSGMNALLKTLEEPPANAILFLISHGEVAILPTIRSRCQTLNLLPLSQDETRQVLAEHDITDKLALELAAGRPGYGQGMMTPTAAKATQAARDLLRSIRKPTSAIVSQALQAASADDIALAAYADCLMQWTAEQATTTPELSDTWLALQEIRAEGKDLNLTATQIAAKMLAILQDGVKSLASTA